MNKNIKNRSLLNNSEIARRLGVTPQYIGQVMRGEKPGKRITPKILALIERTLRNSLRAALWIVLLNATTNLINKFPFIH